MTVKKLALCLVKIKMGILTQSSIVDMIAELAKMEWLITLSICHLAVAIIKAPELAMSVVMNMVVRTITMVTVAFVKQK